MLYLILNGLDEAEFRDWIGLDLACPAPSTNFSIIDCLMDMRCVAFLNQKSIVRNSTNNVETKATVSLPDKTFKAEFATTLVLL
ncbi:hypothetical protein CEXT_247691 [Caerostris extrusa]|uniref:Uncharacterized protein n=1 Tax=Caerostris extrusa TaxID=172846 RepID=A0AAV4VQM4_CAEEX|nr:hypothetical protein CEXT_247691 [Caerostris extrusa]